MTGGAIGSLIAQMLPVSDNERKTLLVAGAAAGMTTVFGTPIAAIMLAIELLLFEWTPRSFIPVTVAAWSPRSSEASFTCLPLFAFAAESTFRSQLVLVLIRFRVSVGVLTQLVMAARTLSKLPYSPRV